MGFRESFERGLAKQLARPSGRRGALTGMLLNRRNEQLITEAIAALDLKPGAVAADIGFGGGTGLGKLLERVGQSGTVHGVEISDAMLARATRKYAWAIDAGTLELHETSMSQLPLDDASVNGAITVNTIYFIEDLKRAFTEVAGVLAPGGRFVIGMADPDVMASMPVTQHGFTVRPVDDVIEALRAGHLELVDHRRCGSGWRSAHLLVSTPMA
ncbi:class I SAM-dependent methyltransferase [Haloechinothrix halophila]|uniref:class I SAM-dependent methyltransferase n=1 Tax=Haloechinothrix halophila TaxID=1069073 RepID=UPI00055543D7|nr:methyltransferase domain-containing protein [Haloechinothrix halophila]